MHGLIFLGLPHISFTSIALAIAGLIVSGVSWSLLMRKAGGIYAAWWSHGLADAIILGWGLHWLGYI